MCTRDAEDRTRCRGALSGDAVLPGSLEVSDRAGCARADGRATCLLPGGGATSFATPFAALVRGPGSPCGRTDAGEVWCFADPAADEADAALVALPFPAPVVALGADGERLLALGADRTLYAARPPGHGGGAPTVVAAGVDALASDGWTLACWLLADEVACTGAPGRWPRDGATRLAVGPGTVCAAGAAGVRCAGVDGDLGAGPVDELAVGAGFGCALRGGTVRCAGAAPP